MSARLCRIARLIVVAITIAAPAFAHDLEKTHVSITFARDGSFVADVANDPSWLKLRLDSIPGPFADRVVLWVDGREIRPSSVEFIPGTPAVNRLRGRVPVDARTLRWFYGLVIDPYPLTIRRADGRLVIEEVAGDAWSRTIDLSGQFHAPLVNQWTVGTLVGLLLLVPVAIRIVTRAPHQHQGHRGHKGKSLYGLTLVSLVSLVLNQRSDDVLLTFRTNFWIRCPYVSAAYTAPFESTTIP